MVVVPFQFKHFFSKEIVLRIVTLLKQYAKIINICKLNDKIWELLTHYYEFWNNPIPLLILNHDI